MARKYDNDIKDKVIDAVRAAVEAGQEAAVKLVAQEYEIPYPTVYFWAKSAGVIGVQSREQKKKDIDYWLEVKAIEALEAWKAYEKGSRDVAIAAGIFVQRLTERQTLRMEREAASASSSGDWLDDADEQGTEAKEGTAADRDNEQTANPDAAIPVSTEVG